MALERLRQELEAAKQYEAKQAADRKRKLQEEANRKAQEATIPHEQRKQQALDFRQEIKLEEVLTRFKAVISGSENIDHYQSPSTVRPKDPDSHVDKVFWNRSENMEPGGEDGGDPFYTYAGNYLIVETTPDRTIRVHAKGTDFLPVKPFRILGFTILEGDDGGPIPISESDLKKHPNLLEEALVRAYHNPLAYDTTPPKSSFLGLTGIGNS